MAQIKKENIQGQLLRAARREFLRHGFQGASLRGIAERAQVSLANIYNYYRDKDALYVAVLQPRLDDIERMKEFFHDYQPALVTFETFETEMQQVNVGLCYLDQHRAEMNLLLNRSAGSKLEQYPEELVEGFTQNFARLMARLAEHHPDQRVYQPSRFFMETVARLFLNTVREMLRQNLPLPEMQKIAVEITAYDYYGYMGLLKQQGMDPRLIDN